MCDVIVMTEYQAELLQRRKDASRKAVDLPSLSDRLVRMQARIERINVLMQELRSLPARNAED